MKIFSLKQTINALTRSVAVSVCAVVLTLSAMMTASTVAVASTPPIGTWKTYMAYSDIRHIVKVGNRVYVVASGDLYVYDTSDESITTMDRNNGLSDTDIKFISWNAAAKRLVIVYSNGNIDLLSEKLDITNISDYYDKSLTYDKTINNVITNGNLTYLATGFGIVVVNVSNATIADTYALQEKVNALCINNGMVYAATDNEIFKGDMRKNLADPNEWDKLASEGFSWLFWMDEGLVGAKKYNISTIASDGTVKKQAGPYMDNCVMQNGLLFACGGNDTYCYHTASDRGGIAKHLNTVAADPKDGSFWIHDDDGSLANITLADDRSFTINKTGIKADGPDYNTFGFMLMRNGTLYTCGGPGSSTSREGCVQVLSQDGTWKMYDTSFAKDQKSPFISAYALAIDPKDEKHVYVAARTGLYEFYDGEFRKLWNEDNSPITHADVKEDAWYKYNKVTTLCFLDDGSLLCFNSETADGKTSLLSLKDDKWTDLSNSNFIATAGFSFPYAKDMFRDSRGLIWFCNNNWQTACLACYQPSSGASKSYRSIFNQDGKEYQIYYVSCVTEDIEGNIWIGTDVGPLMLPASQIGTDDDTFTQVKIPRNDGTNLADYLLSNVPISAIYVDGAGRKWFGTSGNGVYLISADNIQQLQHFTSSNSNLLSDDIERITANEQTGEVFFGTSAGLCSYMADATKPSEKMTKDNVYAYPNPVKPDYTGLITVTGLTLNADVKIVTSNGTLVAQGRSNGGTFTWDGCDAKGKRVASGIYMVETATEDGGKGTVCKIAVIK